MKRLLPFLFIIGLCLIVSCDTGSSLHAPQPVDTAEPPYTPFNFKAEVTSPSAIRLTWNDTSLNEEGFIIYRNGINIAMLDSDSTHYDDTDLVGGQTYRYTVKANNKAGESGGLSCTVKMPSPSLNVTLHQIGKRQWG